VKNSKSSGLPGEASAFICSIASKTSFGLLRLPWLAQSPITTKLIPYFANIRLLLQKIRNKMREFFIIIIIYYNY
jgi:hypothetical protein